MLQNICLMEFFTNHKSHLKTDLTLNIVLTFWNGIQCFKCVIQGKLRVILCNLTKPLCVDYFAYSTFDDRALFTGVSLATLVLSVTPRTSTSCTLCPVGRSCTMCLLQQSSALCRLPSSWLSSCASPGEFFSFLPILVATFRMIMRGSGFLMGLKPESTQKPIIVRARSYQRGC